ncbi:MAG: hypothetical protein ACYC1B_06980 [Thermoleophilia bacterium]
MAGWVSEQADRWKHGAGIAWNSYLSPVVNVVFDEVFTLADPDSSWSERGIAVVFLASGGVGKAAKGVKLADDLFDGAKALDRVGDARRGIRSNTYERVISREELLATQRTGLLRGGRTGENFFTSNASLDAKRSQQRLGLDGPLRDYRIRFQITGEVSVTGPRGVPPGKSGTPGGGIQYSTNELTQIEIIRIDALRR